MLGVFEIEELKLRGQFCLLSFKYYSEKHEEINIDEVLSHVMPLGKIHYFRFYDLLYFSCKAYSDLENTPFDVSYAKFIQSCSELDVTKNSDLLNKLFETRILAQSIAEIIKSGSVQAKKK